MPGSMVPHVFTVELPGLGRPTPTSFEEAIALTGHGRFHRLLLVCCGMAITCVIAVTINTSYVMPSVGCEILMTSNEKGLLNSMVFIGMICSSHLWGFLADTRGRKPIILAGFLMDTVCTISSSFTNSYWLYLLLRFLNGFTINATAAINYAYLGEFHPDSTRTQAIMWCNVFVSLASILLPGLAWVVIPQPWSVELPAFTFSSWRVFLLLCSAPSLVTAALFTLMPESPKFLLTQGRHDEALAILRRIYSLNTSKPSDTYPVQRLMLSESSVDPPASKQPSQSFQDVMRSVWRQTALLFVPPHLLSTVISFLLLFVFFCVGNGVMLRLPEIFNTMSQFSALAPDQPSSVCASYHGLGSDNTTAHALLQLNDSGQGDMLCSTAIDPIAFQNTLIAGGVSCVMYLAAGVAVHFISRKSFTLLLVVVAAACGLGLDFVNMPSLVTALACVMVSVLFIGVSVVSSFVVDVFPTHLRGMAMSLGLMAGRIGTVSGNMILGALLEHYCDVVFYFIAAICLGCALPTFLLPGIK
ncbi:synaptic vesicle glycoprotein 2B-like isoform X2 [Bacillus rossius redtenbacheri]|uniref:synaptic vesicle glycoprotein 2B-like isoform X2 n=1 Tax=Bacillus rossius redtenbacheri TaxID=93214 RepID=UPI002FDEBB91